MDGPVCVPSSHVLCLEGHTTRPVSVPHVKYLLLSRLLTVELQFKLKAINLQTVRHQELPDCYDFTLTVSVGCVEIGSCLEKIRLI